ncbi:hypothetical protein ACFQX4_25470 [Roseomonas sp. GCM10028921]
MPEHSDPLSGLRILLVEDEYVIADEMTGWLRRAGAEVVGPVPSVEQALDLIDEAEGALDAAVLDANLGFGETAYPIADRLDELGVPYAFATADVNLISKPSYQSHPRLEKPISQRNLLRVLERMRRSHSGGEGILSNVELYRSQNGNVWRLIRGGASDRGTVRHEANALSGGHVTEIPVDEFLNRGGAGPEYAAAREALASSAKVAES